MKNKGKTIFNDGMLAEGFSSFFDNVIKSLNISPKNLALADTTNLSKPDTTNLSKPDTTNLSKQ